MELATALIWTLRIVLPIFLFCIYFKLQAPKDEQFAVAGPSKHCINRGIMLAHRRAVLSEPVPEVLSDLTLKDQSEAPALFTPSSTSRAGRPGPGGRKEAGGRDRRPRERGEPKRPLRDAVDDAEADGAVPSSPLSPLSPSEEKMHLESLLNYVAFNRKDQQRTFLPDEEYGPPPPPPKPQRRAGNGAAPELRLSSDITASVEKANAEAQMVLRGAINFKRADVARDLYIQLVESQVEVTERTFALMIDACILARDFKSASDFLMKMEAAGYCPDSELLDKVMDLYSQQKSQRDQEKQVLVGAPTPMDPAMNGPVVEAYVPQAEEVLDGPRAKLSSDAPIFVPSFAVAPPAPQETSPTGEDAADEGNATAGSPPARTKLTSSAKPFEPQFGFDPYMYTWPAEQGDEAGADGRKGRGKDAKGRGQGWKEEEDKENGEDEASPQAANKARSRGRKENEKSSEDAAAVELESGKPSKAKAKAWKPKAVAPEV